MRERIRIAVDAMGGDLGPIEVLKGVVDVARSHEANPLLIVVGNETVLAPLLASLGTRPPNLELRHAEQTITMTDRPSEVLRRKADASVVVAAKLVKAGEADAFISIGNTGAAMASALMHLRPIAGIDRPAIASVLPAQGAKVVMLDMGATVDCSPQQLLEFAVMGLVYARRVLGRSEPRVALLSNGEESSKGNDVTKRAHAMLRRHIAEFAGNIEAGDVFRGKADVVVCDGFDGNVVLKAAEGVAEMVLAAMREELTRHPWMRLALVPLRPAMRRLKARLDYREFGGAPLLGVNGVCVVGHGRSDARAVANAVRVGIAAVGGDLVDEIRSGAEKLKGSLAASEPACDQTQR